MCRIILLGGMLAMLSAIGATTLAFKTIKPQATRHLVAPAKPVDPAMAILRKHLQNSRKEMVLP
jgi:hypothetical protein